MRRTERGLTQPHVAVLWKQMQPDDYSDVTPTQEVSKMDNDAIAMPVNDALAIEYQCGYGTSRWNGHVSDSGHDSSFESIGGCESLRVFEESVNVALR